MNRSTTYGARVRSDLEQAAGEATMAGNQNDWETPFSAAPDAPRGEADSGGGEPRPADFDRAQIMEIKAMVAQLLAASKPILTPDEAAELLSVSPKRFSNIIYEERKRLDGKLPDFVCDADGVLSRRILRDPLMEWVRRPGRRGRRSRARRSGRAAV